MDRRRDGTALAARVRSIRLGRLDPRSIRRSRRPGAGCPWTGSEGSPHGWASLPRGSAWSQMRLGGAEHDIRRPPSRLGGAEGGMLRPTMSLGGEAGGVVRPTMRLGGEAGGVARPTMSLGGEAGGVARPTMSLGGEAGGVARPTMSLGGEAGGVARPTMSLGGEAGGARRPASRLGALQPALRSRDSPRRSAGRATGSRKLHSSLAPELTDDWQTGAPLAFYQLARG
jgi:hypothetical protein